MWTFRAVLLGKGGGLEVASREGWQVDGGGGDDPLESS